MAPVRVLVLGFSVVAETPGFVELAQARDPARFAFRKIGIGGVHLRTFRYLLPLLLDDHECDLLILEVGTPGLRRNDPEEKRDYAGLMGEVLGYLAARGQCVALWDLPRLDSCTGPDAIYDTHAALTAQHGIAYRRTPFQTGALRDGIHATAAGHAFYATELLDLVREVIASGAIGAPRTDPQPTPSHTAIPVTSLWPHSEIVLDPLSRSGLHVDLAAIPSEASVTLTVPEAWNIRGFSYLIGPKSGTFAISSPDGTAPEQIAVYDAFSFYRHLGMKLFARSRGTSVTLMQLEHLPDVVLIKGVADSGPRCGFIGHLLVSSKEGLA